MYVRRRNNRLPPLACKILCFLSPRTLHPNPLKVISVNRLGNKCVISSVLCYLIIASHPIAALMSNSPQSSLPSTKEVVMRVFGDVKEYSKLVGQIPTEDYDYHEAFSGFRRQVMEQSDALIDLMDTCTLMLPKRRRVPLIPEGGSPATNQPPHNLSEAQRTTVMEAIESLLENVDTVLDELRGRKMRSTDQLSVTFGSELALGGAAAAAAAASAAADSSRGVVHVAHVMRPQLTFEAPVDNSDSPSVPVYHDAAGVRHTGKPGVHPFAEAVAAFAIPQEQMLPRADTPAVPLQSCPLTFVDSAEDLQRVVGELMAATEIAVDLEHHDFYSYQGFTCLMQLSSRSADYIVDCLRLRASMHLLAPVFLNPKILKVLHGAREDVRWLQKDFGLYLINFFDTGIALQTLHMPHSLAFAVDHFCQIKLEKRFQTADWRVRPLSAEMVHYARQDTHFLLYIYDRLKALLLNSENRASIGNLLAHVYAESRRLSLDLYEKPHLRPDESYKAALGRSLGGLSPVQEQVARAIFNWRDAAAREVDDSPTAVLHLSSVLAIASKLPTTAKDLLRCCSPASVILRRSAGELVEMVKAALGDSADAAALAAAAAANDATGDADAAGKDATVAVFAVRPLGVYRPMTGALPSISARVAPPAPTASPSAECTLTGTKHSLWFQAMQQLSKTVAARPQQHVALPGSEVLATLQARRQRRLAEAPAKPSDGADEEDDGPAGKRPKRESSSDEDEATAVGSKPGDGAPLPAAEEKIDLPEGAFSMRQEFGTGAQDRKKAKSTAAKKEKNKV